MIHKRERLPLGLKAGDDVAGIHAGLDDLERDLTPHGPLLFGDEHQAEAAFADLLHELVRADHRAGAFGKGVIHGRRPVRIVRTIQGGHVHKDVGCFVGVEQGLNFLAQLEVIGTGLVDIRGPLVGRQPDRPHKDLPFRLSVFTGHCVSP